MPRAVTLSQNLDSNNQSYSDITVMHYVQGVQLNYQFYQQTVTKTDANLLHDCIDLRDNSHPRFMFASNM